MTTVLRRCNVDSYNLYAESLFKRLGYEVTRAPGSWSNGAAVLRMVLQEHLGIDAGKAFTVADGSGMSRNNRVTPRMLALWLKAMADDEKIVVGFATAASGFMQAYDKPAQDAAMIRIDEINKAGGLLGKQIEVVTADTKTDRAEGAKAGLEVIDKGADLVVVSCDYDFGSPAALAAESAGLVSFFLCAESVKAGIQGVGPRSFSASVLAAVQGATMAEWGLE